MYLYGKDYDPKKGREHKSNRDHYVVIDSGSAAEKAYVGQGFSANAEYDAKADAADAADTTVEDDLAAATEAAEQKLQREHAQRVAAEAKAVQSGISANPNDQSRESPNTESTEGKTVKEAVGEKPAGADSKTAVADKVAGKDEASASKK